MLLDVFLTAFNFGFVFFVIRQWSTSDMFAPWIFCHYQLIVGKPDLNMTHMTICNASEKPDFAETAFTKLSKAQETPTHMILADVSEKTDFEKHKNA